MEFSSLFYLIAGILLFILGINIFKPLGEMISSFRKSEGGNIVERGGKWFEAISRRSLTLGALFLGILFAVGWAPCAISLVLPTVVTKGMRAKIGNAYISAGRVIEKIFAVAILVIAILFILRYFRVNLW